MKKARACFADGGQISKADQMIAEMNAKYGVSGNSQPAPQPVAQPAPQPAPQQNSKGLIGDALNLFGNRQKQIDKAAGYADGGLIRNAAEYWADDNAEFEKTNPGFVSRVVRGINPMTGFGSAMGAMHTAASNGDIPGMVMSGIQAIPAVGSMRAIPASGAVKAAVSPSIGKTVSSVFGGGAVNAAADEFSSEKNKGYANGGLIQGIGSPTSDSIDAQVNETGEPIKVSTKERIVSHEQDKLLQRLAKAMGFESVDALFEAGTGKPVGPTIKAGKRAAEGGLKLDNKPDEYAKAMQDTRNRLSISSLATNNSAAQGGIYKDVGFPAMNVGAGQAPTIYDNGGLPTKTDRVSGSLPVASAPQNRGIGIFDKDPLAAMSEMIGRNNSAVESANADVKKLYPAGTFDEQSKRPAGIASGTQSATPVNPLVAGIASSPFGPAKERFPLGTNGESMAVQDGPMTAAQVAPGNNPLVQPAQKGIITADSAAAAYGADGARTNLGTMNLAEQNERMAKSLGYAGTDDFNKQFRLRNDPVQMQAELAANGAPIYANQRRNADLEGRLMEGKLRQQGIVSGLQEKAIGGDKNALASLRMITGDNKEPNYSNRYISVQGGEETGPDGMTKIRRPSRVFDAQAGQWINEGGQAAQQQSAPASAIEYLKKNPHQAEAFKAKYGYIPAGL